jgi:hypothetical protein
MTIIIFPDSASTNQQQIGFQNCETPLVCFNNPALNWDGKNESVVDFEKLYAKYMQ